MAKALSSEQFRLGVCYYPEQWPESLWDDDFRRMRELGFSVVRMAEFAWSIFEPADGQFSFELFDRVLDLAHQHGLGVILGTPTATPPAWLTHAHPEVLNATREGLPYQHGQRRHYSYNAPIYRELSARIVTQLAEHYGQHPALIGWQIDNELNCEVNVFYAEADHTAFRAWLQGRYESLDALNAAWGTVFWNQTYSDWAQVRLTGLTPSDSPNPHQALDEKRFISDSAIGYAAMQAEIIRPRSPGRWVTTNGMFGHLDSYALTEQALDFFSYDSYPNFATIYPDAGPEPLLDRIGGWNLSRVRGISPTFAIMEQQSGPGGWVNRMAQPAPKPGQMRLWTYQSIAHGADMLLYFRWRTATMGTEIYWHGLNDYHNQPNRRIAEVAQIGQELATIGPQIVGAQVVADVGIVLDYDNEWDGELDVWHGPLSQQSTHAWVKALQYQHIPCDAVYMRPTTSAADLARYRLLVYPHAAILSEEMAAVLAAYVEQGGALVLGCRTGYKLASGQVAMRPMPGPLAELCGVTVADFTRVGPHEQPPALSWIETSPTEGIIRAELFNEQLTVQSPQATVLAEYGSGFYSGSPVLVRNPVGAGRVYTYGSTFTQPLAEFLLFEIGISSPAVGLFDLPRSVELCLRQHPATGQRFAFLLNYSGEFRELELLRGMRDALGAQLEGYITLEPYGVRVIALDA